MEFTKIQKGNNWIQFRLNNIVVSRNDYETAEILASRKDTFSTSKTKRGNWKHSFYGYNFFKY